MRRYSPSTGGIRALRPAPAPTWLLCHFTNLVLRKSSIRRELDSLHGRSVAVAATDTPIRMTIRIRYGCLEPATIPADVTISGPLRSFWLIATRREDPDTLFFQRRLSIEGDTETGLRIKNLLDSLSFDAVTHGREILASLPLGNTAIQLLDRLPRLPGR